MRGTKPGTTMYANHPWLKYEPDYQKLLKRMSQGYAPCLKCDKKLTSHSSQICVECNQVKCTVCGELVKKNQSRKLCYRHWKNKQFRIESGFDYNPRTPKTP